MKLTMTEELLRYNHYNLWNWLAKTGLDKKESPMMKTLARFWANEFLSDLLIDVADVECFACGVGFSIYDCKCPIQWITQKDAMPCLHNKSLYHKWEGATTIKTRKKYAAKIAKLPWRGGSHEAQPHN